MVAEFTALPVITSRTASEGGPYKCDERGPK